MQGQHPPAPAPSKILGSENEYIKLRLKSEINFSRSALGGPLAVTARRCGSVSTLPRDSAAPGRAQAVCSKPMPEGLASGGADFKPWLVSLEEHHRDPLFSFVEGARDGISITIPIYVIIV